MRGILFFTAILIFMAVVDFWQSSKLLASMRLAETANTFADSRPEIDLVEQALNSRYMQWGAVGVMLSLFVWIVTRHLPNQERRRDAERREERQAFLETLKNRDAQYLGALSEIRNSVEQHSERHHVAKENITNALNILITEVRQMQ